MTAIPLSRPSADRPPSHRPPVDLQAVAAPAGDMPGPDMTADTGRPATGVPETTAAASVTVIRNLARSHRSAMVWRRAFRGVREQARAAREFVRVLLADVAVVDDAVQVAGELVANAVVHTRSGRPGGLYVLEVCRWRGGASVAVTDQGGPGEPRLVTTQPAEHGNGMRAVAALASWWGWYGDPRGRTVTAVFTRGRGTPATVR
jgi:serine/threonine-protein kinase RsbW